jgi:hypothetical protein
MLVFGSLHHSDRMPLTFCCLQMAMFLLQFLQQARNSKEGEVPPNPSCHCFMPHASSMLLRMEGQSFLTAARTGDLGCASRADPSVAVGVSAFLAPPGWGPRPFGCFAQTVSPSFPYMPKGQSLLGSSVACSCILLATLIACFAASQH